MLEKPRRRDALANWENEGGWIDTDPRDRDEAAGAPGLPASPARDKGRTDTQPAESRKKEKEGGHDMNTKAITGAVGLIVAVALGGVSGAWVERRSNDELMAAAVQEEAARAERLNAEVAGLHERGVLLELHLRLGRIAIEADRQDYGTAGERAARFFDDLARVASETAESDPELPALRHVLAARDEIIAGLATAQPAAAQRLEQLYLDVFSMMQLPSLHEKEVPHETSR
jgi:hypothetical protein